ncbi:hypothetical protein [Burkholderia latens]|uniref:hypothetical protein n=1 Tax=Burkholderia latens TaxID=488446 RepID=UPI000AE47837|nr:hypothetical protein [Burkholderia latens]
MNKTLKNERIEELALLNLGYDRQVRLRDFARAIEREVLATQRPEPRDAIARSKRILGLVDSYHENPTQHTRTALRAALMDEFQPEPRAEVTDTERLDWLIEQQAWIQWTVRDGSIRQCQVFDQDEDENYHILSGEDRYFNTPREAIDAARAGEAS